MKILVTGGAGFIGSHVVDRYIDEGHQVVVVDDLSSGVKSNVNQKAKLIELDVRSKEIEKVLEEEKPEIINHHAAHIHVGKSVEDPGFDADVNIMGLINLMEAARKVGGVKRVIFSSTGGAMYGDKQTPFSEGMMPQPLSPYGISKRASELYLYFYKQQYGIEYVALRYANVYGPRQNPHGEAGVVAIFCEGILDGKVPVINGDGKQTRDYVFVSDVVEANSLALKTKVEGEINIGTATEVDVNQIFKMVTDILSPGMGEKHGSPRPGEQETSSLDYTLAKEKLGWEPKVEIEEGIKRTVEYFQNK
jgi:UDP-glucose 4-epimerase